MESSFLQRLSSVERLNFLLTNRIPRRWATRFMGRFSRVRNPLVRDLSMFVWQSFADDLRLDEAETRHFDSLHDCFTRRLKPGARPVDPDPEVLVSPCDAVVGECGRVEGERAFQAKGFPYTLTELMGDASLVDRYRDGTFVTLRLKSSMYHRFHAPADGRVRDVRYIAGDTWNVNPIALKRVERLFCKNERAAIELELDGAYPGETVCLVAVAAILVASIQLAFLDYPLNLAYRGPNRLSCDAHFRRGDEMGYFQHGSTILVFVPGRWELCAPLAPGQVVRMGRPLLRVVQP